MRRGNSWFPSRFLLPELFSHRSLLPLVRVLLGAHQVQRDVRLIADHPAVVSGRDVEDVASFHLDHAAIVHGGDRSSGDHNAYMLDVAALLPHCLSDMRRPFPAGLVTGAADRHSTDIHQLKMPLFEGAALVGRFKAL